MKIFIIHSMGLSSKALEYAKWLESDDHETFVPVRDTEQDLTTEHEILNSNLNGLKWCDEAHVIWDLSSLGSIFDMGCAYALGKPIHIVSTKKHHWVKFILKNKGKRIL